MKYKKWVCFAGLFVIAVIVGKSLIESTKPPAMLGRMV